MSIDVKENNLDNFIVVGDRVLIKPKKQSDKTNAGLYLPPTVKEKEPVSSGYVVKAGPGYPIPAINEEEAWKSQGDTVKYVPLQAMVGDLAVFLNKSGFEVEINKQKYFIVPQSAILLLHRDKGLFEK